MGFLSGSLLVVSLLNLWCLPPTASISTINAFPGDDVILQLTNKHITSGHFKWYRGQGENEQRPLAFLTLKPNIRVRWPAYGRVTINYDGSLLIQNVTRSDEGIYSVVNYLRGLRNQIRLRRVKVYEPVRMPVLNISRSTVTEDEDVVSFTCHTDEANILWLFYSMKLQFTERMKLSDDHRSFIIDPVKREDAGNYQCAVLHPVRSLYSGPVELKVKVD